MRLKKFRGATLQTCGIPTRQRRLFADQQPLTGFPESTNLVLGYTVNDFGTGIDRMAITCSTRATLNWVLDVPFPGEGTVIDYPQPQIGPVEPSIRSTQPNREDASKSAS